MFNKDLYFEELDTAWLGAKLVVLDTVTSTNTWIAERLDEPQIHKTLVIAENQTVGRGRLGRSWSSPPGVNLAFSLAWATSIETQNISAVTLAAGVALCEACEEVADLSPALKYPNDLMFNGKKAGGILTELKRHGSQNNVIIGMGVNVNTQLGSLPEELHAISTSLLMVTGKKVTRETLLAAIANHLERWLNIFTDNGPKPVVEKYLEYCAPFLKREVEVRVGERIMTGVAIGIDERGGLLVEVSPGVVEAVYSGETRFFDPIIKED